MTFAKVGKRVVLADCELRHPAQHILFSLANVAGVTTALRDEAAALPLMPSEIPGLRVLTSGPGVDGPSDLLCIARDGLAHRPPDATRPTW